MKNSVWKKTAGFLNGKGFYIVLGLCIAVIGVSGYVMTRAAEDPPAAEPLPDLNLAYSEPEPSVTEKPVNQLITGIPKPTSTPTPTPVPTPAPTPTPAAAFFMRPVAGKVGTDYSGEDLVYNPTLDDWRVHAGIDICAEVGTQVRAAASGEVTRIYTDGLFGVTVEISHPENYVTRYAGLQENPSVTVGDTVEAGDVIGGVGTTALGETIDPVHLHFEVWKNGCPVDPESVLPAPAN